MVKYIIISGGVLSGLGKGIIASSTGLILKSYGIKVTSVKIDPYLNIDAGTMSPFEHGEVFILDDGGEVDLDLGNYERLIDLTLTRDNNITTGKIYSSVIQKERRGDYLGKTVQVVPHICNEIQDWISRVASVSTDGSREEPEVCVIELGGTVGDIESAPFIEALRQFQFKVGKHNFCLIHVSLVPVVGAVGEQKSKPTQQSVKELRALGLSPDIIVGRATSKLEQEVKDKLKLFCHVSSECVFSCHDVTNLYRVPLLLVEQGFHKQILKILHMDAPIEQPDLKAWSKLANEVDQYQSQEEGIKIVMVGKYTGMSDSYTSVDKSLQHASHYIGKRLFLEWINATDLEDSGSKAWSTLRSANGILVPGGFGSRGIEGKILAAKYARENKVPYLGICLGLQVAVIEIARSLLGWKDANTEELDEDKKHDKNSQDDEDKKDRNVIIFMPEISKTHKGGTMRLGVRKTIIKDKDSIAYQLYNKLLGNEDVVLERHRHRYEVNPKYLEELSKAGLKFVGKDETGLRQEIIEISDHPFYLCVQYHPEMKSRPMKPSPPFIGLMLAAAGKLQEWKSGTWKK